MKGVFTFFTPDGGEFSIPNIVPDEGEEAYLQILYQGNDAIVPISTGNYYVGLAVDETVGEDATLATITELSETGYARIPLARNATDWPVIAQTSGDYYAQSKTITFTADVAGWTTGFRRAFLTNVATGTTGVLLAVSGAYAQPEVLGPDETWSMNYTMWLQ